MQKNVMPKKKKVSHIRLYVFAFLFLLQMAIIIAAIYFTVTVELFSDYLWIPVVVLYLTDSILAVFIMNSKVQNDFKISWLVVIIVFPFAGAVIYLIFANKLTTRRKKKIRFNPISMAMKKSKEDCETTLEEMKRTNLHAYEISCYLDEYAYSAVYKNTEVRYFNYGQKGFPVILEELKKAKKFIFLEFFIIEHGIMFNSIYDILKQKAKEGLDVRIIYDDFGSVKKINGSFVKMAAKDGINCFAFNKIRPNVDVRQNSRDHRKILVIDGVAGFTGGCNLADEYINVVNKFGDWRDNIILIKGEAVTGLTSLFLANWNLQFRKKQNPEITKVKKYSYLKNIDLSDLKQSACSGFVQPFGEVPFDGEDNAKTVYLELINNAQKYIYLSTPYLIPDSELVNALCVASKRGVDVKIVTPGIPDKKIVFQMTRSNYAILMMSGVKIYEYKPGFNHTKLMVVDTKMAMSGTVNFDFRSLYLHFENAVFFYQCECIKEMEKDMVSMIEVSKLQKEDKYVNKNWFKRIYWAILKLLGPLL